jgi:hypothetical protein
MEHAFISVDTVSVGKSTCSPWGTIAFCKNWCMVCYYTDPNYHPYFLWLHQRHSEVCFTILSAFCNPVDWWGSSYWLHSAKMEQNFTCQLKVWGKLKAFWRLGYLTRTSADNVLRFNPAWFFPVECTEGNIYLTQLMTSKKHLPGDCRHFCRYEVWSKVLSLYL